MADRKPHAIFIPYPLQGHVIPSVNLAIKLASQGFTITFINTHSVHQKITKSQSNATETDIFACLRKTGLDIRYTTISDGLPVEFDRSLNHDQFMLSLLHVFSAHVEETVAKILREKEEKDKEEDDPPVTCLIADTFYVWPGKIARKFKLLYVSFWTEPALVFTLYYHLDLLCKNGHFACNDVREDAVDYIPGVESIYPKDMMSYLQDTDITSVVHQIIFKAFEDVKTADFVLCNTIQELEINTISALSKKIPFYSIGPIFPSGSAKTCVSTSLWSEFDCTHWLDTKPHGSVLYVSFGSYAHLKKSDLAEIANGLLLTKVSFVWVLRPDIVSATDTDPLPVGFKEEVADRAIIIPWCNQRAVLSHKAIGGFLSHCGWNSLLESIRCGVPLLCFPLLTDQFTNRKLVVDDWRVGINLSDKRLIMKEEVSEKINRLMCGKSADEYRTRIRELGKKLENAVKESGSSEKNMDKFVKELKGKIQSKCGPTKVPQEKKGMSDGN